MFICAYIAHEYSNTLGGILMLAGVILIVGILLLKLYRVPSIRFVYPPDKKRQVKKDEVREKHNDMAFQAWRDCQEVFSYHL